MLLLAGTVLFASGVLFAKFKLEAFRESVQGDLAARLGGAQLEIGTVKVNGLRGFRIDGLRISVEQENGPSITLDTPVAYVHINLNGLLYGQVTYDRIVLDKSQITLERPLEADWYPEKGIDYDSFLTLTPTDAFRVTGKDCKVNLINVVGETQLSIERFTFDVSRLLDAPDLVASLAGDLSGDPDRHIDMKLRLASLEDFDLRLSAEMLTAEDVNVILPAQQQLVTSGLIKPTVRISGHPNRTLVLDVQAPFEKITVRNHPDFLAPATGLLTLLASYEIESNLLTLTTAKADCPDLSGDLGGTISFAGTYPEFDLSLRASRLPITEIINHALDNQLNAYGHLDVALSENHELNVTLKGPSDALFAEGHVNADSGKVSFTPLNKNYPSIDLSLGTLEGSWDDESGTFNATVTVLDGTLHHEPSGLTGTGVYGTLSLNDGVVSMDPFNAQITGNALVGGFEYDVAKDTGSLSFEGTLSNIEQTTLASAISLTSLSGSATFKGEAVKETDRFVLDGHLDITQTAIDHSWWFQKPVGIGVDGDIHAVLRPNHSLILDVIRANAASSQIYATAKIGYSEDRENPWQLDSITAHSDHLDIDAIGKCVVVPYRIAGGKADTAHYRYDRDPDFEGGWHQEMSCYIDRFSLFPDHEDATIPLECEGLVVEAEFDKGANPKGVLKINTRNATMPELGMPWFLPFDKPDDAVERSWTYELAADALALPPWKGTHFTGTAFTGLTTQGFTNYSADIEEGHISGSYNLTKANNEYHSKVTWEQVPAKYFIAHLNLPSVLWGPTTGEISYFLDQDDPGTLSGDGNFTVNNGQFSADFLYSLLQEQSEGQPSTLPPDLNFTLLSTEVKLRGDTVETNKLRLDSEGIKIRGGGNYVRDGDMDYSIDLALTPDTAEQIAAIRDNLNLNAFRLSGKPIEMSFDIDGPTFSPRSELAGLPSTSVTLLGSALGVIDSPRRILVDLLKIGGGLVGVN